MPSVAPFVLAGFWLWGVLDRKQAAYHAAQYRPFKIADDHKFAPSDVSVVCCSLEPEANFVDRLEGWLLNSSLEVIVVTCSAYLAKFQSTLEAVSFDISKVRVSKRTGRAYVMQIIRWECSTTPQIWRNAYLAHLFRDVIILIHLWAFGVTLKECPMLAYVLLFYYVYRMVEEYRASFKQYP
ncbi:hypothetical protein B0H67DRAFT_610808 [Lasiosphaeris hirsuta]|uniref:Uncharacterized protein n=1 Tax=Lasiosphaeris hirsuta TaxID=260670 RepID=A0AA40AI40_9PEZI|nr:hypothetical protein B0H67DRAFT_610808 [Lasiosphaeris hirsuta]